MIFRYTLFVFIAVGLLSCSACNKKDTTDTATPTSTENPVIKTEEILNGYEVIWGMDFLPNSDLIFGEKKGKMYRKSGTVVKEITGLPAINANGQGGLLDIRVSPSYATNGWIFCTFAGNATGGGGSWNLMRFKLVDDKVTEPIILITSSTSNGWNGHYGSRIDFDEAGNLYASVGEGGTTSYGGETSPNQNAQMVNITWGKIHRITQAGAIASGNPVLPGNTFATTVYSYGHRNPQGLIFNPFTKDLWESEHGPKGGDELNIIKAGENYGWPLVSYGVNYDGVPVSASPTKTGITAPIHTWTPSIGACGLAFITSNKFKAWKGNLLAGALASQYLARLVIKDNKVVSEEKLLDKMGRVRNIKQAPDGSIYVSIEGPGRIIKITAE